MARVEKRIRRSSGCAYEPACEAVAHQRGLAFGRVRALSNTKDRAGIDLAATTGRAFRGTRQQNDLALRWMKALFRTTNRAGLGIEAKTGMRSSPCSASDRPRVAMFSSGVDGIGR